VEAEFQNKLHYGTAGGATPNVVADYGSDILSNGPNFGDLGNVLYHTRNPGYFELTLTADAGRQVSLNSFDMAGYAHVSYTIPFVRVLDITNHVLFSQENVFIDSSPTGHTHFDFAPPLTGQSLTIQFNPDAAGDKIGFDNVLFSQFTPATPPPPTVASRHVFYNNSGW